MKKLFLPFLLFFSIQSFSQIANDSMIVKIKLSQDELKSLILKETKAGGKFDFFTPIKGKEYEAVWAKPNVISTNIGMALYSWGKATVDEGMDSAETSLSIFEEFKGRKLNQREIEYIKLGFNKGLEK